MEHNGSATISGSQVTRWRALSLKLFTGLIISLIVCAGVVFFTLRRVERAIAFHPQPAEVQADGVAGAEDVWFTNKAGNRLHGWFFQSSTRSTKASLIYFHGNGGNIENIGWIGERFAARGFNVLLFDYRGYGRSEGYLEDEEGLYADADAAYEYVLTQRGVDPKSLVLYGQSLGTAAVTDLASRRQCAAIVLESGMSSGSEMAKAALPWLPHSLYFLAKNRFDSARKLSLVHSAVLITHGEPDETVPTAQARALYAAANEPRRLLIFPGAGHNVFGFVGDKYLDLVASFIDEAITADQNNLAGR
ncbi:MAG TPA: alpha/beta hydrolase [Pyrinomonadaceae bacterium]|nr:alpha/beta hydrolase [Pyrinomonadaceae bacterium]